MDLIFLLVSQIFLWIGLPLIIIAAFCEMAGIKSSSFLSGLTGAFFSALSTAITASLFFLTIATAHSTRLITRLGKDTVEKAGSSCDKKSFNDHYYQEVEVEVVEKS